MMNDLPLDIHGNRCRVGAWYWAWDDRDDLRGVGRFTPTGWFLLGDTKLWLEAEDWFFSPAQPPEFPPRKEPHVHN